MFVSTTLCVIWCFYLIIQQSLYFLIRLLPTNVYIRMLFSTGTVHIIGELVIEHCAYNYVLTKCIVNSYKIGKCA
jgi:hypothetical protein